jgi:chromosome segregation protein
VFLRSLTIKGFKSFADATTLEFEPGVTVVVGPNGSGKSNVVDAVAWVLGAQAARAVRSTRMDDVIFAGTPKRPPLGRAEVSLTIDNSAGLLPIEFSEVTITRTLFRNGESEYAINRVPCRLLDIQELLSDTGIGRQQHVIVSQGNLDSVLNARPEERRLVIEEAAGILKYRRRKEKAERRLESTEASLVRLQDLLREVRRQLRPLEKQAEAARRHGGLATELAAVRAHLFGRDLAAIEVRLAHAGRERHELGGLEAALRAELARLDAEVLGAEARVSERRGRRGPDLAELVSTAEGLRARAAGLAAVLTERRRALEQARSARVDHDVIASLEAEAATLAERLAATEEEAEGLLPEADELGEAEARLADEAEVVEAQWGSAPAGPTDPAAETRGELGALRLAAERSAGELARLNGSIDGLRERVGRLEAERQRLAEEVTGADRAAPGLDAAEAEATEEEAAAEVSMARAESVLREAEADRHRWSARAEALAQALDQARARAGAERLAGVGGVVGTLSDLVEVDEGSETAFEAAAGEVLAAVVVDGPDSARRGLAELQRLAAAGAVVPLPEAGAAGVAGPGGAGSGWAGPGGVVGVERVGWLPAGAAPLRPRVRGRRPGVDALLDDLLARAVVVEGSWERALDLALDRPDLVVVTSAGDRFSRGLWRTGAGGPGATGAALGDALERAREAEVRAAQAGEARRLAEASLAAARRARAETSRAGEANRSRRRAAAAALSRVEAEAADRRHELESALARRVELADRAGREARRIAELEALLPELEQLAAVEAERAAAERAARYRLAERAAEVAARRRRLEVRAAGLEERRTLTIRRLREVEERLRRNIAERDDAGSRRAAAEAAAGLVEALSDLVRRREADLERALQHLRAERRAAADAERAEADRLEELRRERAGAERQLSELRERRSRVDTEEAEARVRLEGLTEAIRRDLDCEPEAVREAPCPDLPPGTSPTSRRAELERELRLMGPINPLALEEHQALLERHQFLDSQLEDVRSARRELNKVIRAVDAEITEMFGAAYADVADNFERLFATLFPGGEGRLRLTDPEHLLETGIEVEGRPSGKNLRKLSLLSGGERSLVAMAFLFAVFRSRPSPFYMMDEVEAALDDVNLNRFLGLVAEFRNEAQLLIVTHQKRTMEAADCLYGVTMAPGGSSRVVSERVGAGEGSTRDERAPAELTARSGGPAH